MPNSPTKNLVSRVTRRNSTIEVWSQQERVWLRKTYHAKYQVENEAEAYKQFKEMLADVPGIRTAEVYDVDLSNNALNLEYAQGPTIAEALSSQGCAIIESFQEPLLQLLVLAHEKNTHLDSDPTNFIIENQSNDLILIDPICTEHNLAHFSAIVFLWGMIKNFVSKIYRVDRWLGNAKAWRVIYRDYAARTNCLPGLLSLEMSQYIHTVIKWNIDESSNESLAIRLVRWTLIIPAWSIFRCLFRAHAVLKVNRNKA